MNIGDVELFLMADTRRRVIYEDVTGVIRLEIARGFRTALPMDPPLKKITIKVWKDPEG